MRREWLQEHHQLEAHYWWFVNKRRMVAALLDGLPRCGRMLEVGCGGGQMSAMFLEAGWDVVATDVQPDGAEYARRRGVEKTLVHDAGHGWPFASGAFDAAILLDVLEHIEDDAAALEQLHRVLRPGGGAVVAVPAYQCLFSSWDEYNRHYRRYTAGQLARAARQAGFTVSRTTYWNAVSLPPAVVLRLKDRIRPQHLEEAHYPAVPRVVNRMLTLYGVLEAAWLRRLPLPSGLSAVAVLRKEVQP